MKSVRTRVYEPEGGKSSDTVSGPSRGDTVEMNDAVPNTPKLLALKGVKTSKTSLKKLLANYTDPLSVIDRIMQ
jgi:hypothetical protein